MDERLWVTLLMVSGVFLQGSWSISIQDLPSVNNTNIYGYEGQASVLWCPIITPVAADIRRTWYLGKGTSDRIALYTNVGLGYSPTLEDVWEDRGDMDTSGNITLFNTRLSDELWYTCSFEKYPTAVHRKLVVYVKPEEHVVSIDGHDSIIENKTATLTCKVKRAKPKITNLSWMLDIHHQDGVQQSSENVDGTFTATNTLTWTFKKEDDGKEIICIVDWNGEQLEFKQSLVVHYAPQGSPLAHATEAIDSVATLTCNTTTLHNKGRPLFAWYAWYKGTSMKGNVTTSSWQFRLSSKYDAGNYTCVVGNRIGTSDHSLPTELVVIGEVTPLPGSVSHAPAIAGSIIAVVVIIIIVVIVVYVWKRRKEKDSFATSRSRRLRPKAEGADANPENADPVVSRNGVRNSEPTYAEPVIKKGIPEEDKRPQQYSNLTNNNELQDGRMIHPDGTVYIDVAFQDNPPKKPAKPPRVRRQESPTEYASINMQIPDGPPPTPPPPLDEKELGNNNRRA